jgi:beta propeller repeat protein
MRKLINVFKFKFFWGIFAALSMFIMPVAVSAATLTGTEQQVTTAVGDQFLPVISGDIVVYTDQSSVDQDVWYCDMSDGTQHAVSTVPGDQLLTDVSNGRIVYTDWNTTDVYVLDLATGQTRNLTEAAGSNSLDPAISGDLVAWTDDRDDGDGIGDADIYALNLSTGEQRQIASDVLVDQSPAVGNGVIAWESCNSYTCDVFVYDWATGITTQLTATSYASERYPDVYGRTVVFQRAKGTPVNIDIVAYDLDSGTEKVLELAGDQSTPHISGDFVSFDDWDGNISHIGLWKLSTDEYFQVTQDSSNQYCNDIEGDRIVYTDDRAGTPDTYDYQLDIYIYTFSIQEDTYVFGGFQQPLNADGSSVFKLGRIIPVRFVLADSSGQSIPTATVTISVTKLSNDINGTEEEVLVDSPGNADTGNVFRYDAQSGVYVFNLSTKGYTEGTYRLYAKPDDGQSYSVDFSLK